jgi:hypothetical protein
MDKTIYTPDAQQSTQMMRDAWKDFKTRAEAEGWKNLGEWAIELFIGGYCYGHNSCLNVIRDQIALDGYTIKSAEEPGDVRGEESEEEKGGEER